MYLTFTFAETFELSLGQEILTRSSFFYLLLQFQFKLKILNLYSHHNYNSQKGLLSVKIAIIKDGKLWKDFKQDNDMLHVLWNGEDLGDGQKPQPCSFNLPFILYATVFIQHLHELNSRWLWSSDSSDEGR
jgi:hypothetical protein